MLMRENGYICSVRFVGKAANIPASLVDYLRLYGALCVSSHEKIF